MELLRIDPILRKMQGPRVLPCVSLPMQLPSGADAPPGMESDAGGSSRPPPCSRPPSRTPCLLRGAPSGAAGVGWWLALGALLPMFVLLLRTPFQDRLPIGDVGTIALHVAEVGTRHTPLVGPYSHFGWSHPGPLLFEILAGCTVFGTGAQAACC